MRIAAMAVLGLLLTLAACICWRTPGSYAAQDRSAVAAAPDATHRAGTDDLGRDRALRTSVALLIAMGGACAASALASLFAVSLAAWAALGPRWMASLLLFLSDAGLALPWLFLLMLLRAALPLTLPPLQSGTITFLLLGLLGVPAFFRLNHGRTAHLAGADWMLQAHATGLRANQRMRSMLPHLRPLLLAQFFLYVPACIAAEANLGALGLGLSEPLPSMGNFIANLQSAALLGASRWVYLPVIMLVLVLLTLELGLSREEA